MPETAYNPILLADTSRLTFEEKLEYRKLGLGYSDAATIMLSDTLEKAGYNSVLGLFLDKVSRQSRAELDAVVEKRIKENRPRDTGLDMELFGAMRRPVIDPGVDYSLRAGYSHGLKKAMACYLSCRLGIPVYNVPVILQHPDYPFMITELDFVAVFWDSETGELNRPVNVRCSPASHWKLNELEASIPPAHELECRHQMCVSGLDETILIYLCDNNEGGVVLYKIPHSKPAEVRLIKGEKSFWHSHVLEEVLPFPRIPTAAATRDIALYASQRLQYHKPPEILEYGMPELVQEYTKYKTVADRQKKEHEATVQKLDELKLQLSRFMLDQSEAACGDLRMKWREYKSRSVDWEGLELAHPDIFNRFVTETVKPGFEIRTKKSAAPAPVEDEESMNSAA